MNENEISEMYKNIQKKLETLANITQLTENHITILKDFDLENVSNKVSSFQENLKEIEDTSNTFYKKINLIDNKFKNIDNTKRDIEDLEYNSINNFNKIDIEAKKINNVLDKFEQKINIKEKNIEARSSRLETWLLRTIIILIGFNIYTLLLNKSNRNILNELKTNIVIAQNLKNDLKHNQTENFITKKEVYDNLKQNDKNVEMLYNKVLDLQNQIYNNN